MLGQQDQSVFLCWYKISHKLMAIFENKEKGREMQRESAYPGLDEAEWYIGTGYDGGAPESHEVVV